MPWVRIDENAMDHPKIGALPDGAFRLWVQALAYCQKHLTDGYMSDLAVRSLPAHSPKRRALLVSARLWDAAEGGITVHDYLDWNESRADVVAARQAARDRMRRARDRRSPERSGEQTPGTESCYGERSRDVLRGVVCREETQISQEGEGGSGETIEARAGRFCQWYEDTHRRLFGVGYMGTNADYTKAMEMARKFTDQELRDGALVWFGMDDAFATSGTRTVPKFASRITGCLQEARARGIA